jgi:hypothetical protein
LAAGHRVTVFVRTPSKLPLEVRNHVSVCQGDLSTLAPAEIAKLVSGHDALINCAGVVTEGLEGQALGLSRLRIAVDRLPVDIPVMARGLPDPLLLPVFASKIPQMIVPYADAAALMLAHLGRDDTFARHRVGIALPPGMRGKKLQWAAKPRSAGGRVS